MVRYAGLFVLCIILSANMIKTYSATYKSINKPSSINYGPEKVDSREMFSYISNNTKEQAVIGFFKPRVMNLYTDRISLALFRGYDEIIEKSDYYVENKSAGNYFQIPIDKRYVTEKKHFKLVFSNNDFNIYKILKK